MADALAIFDELCREHGITDSAVDVSLARMLAGELATSSPDVDRVLRLRQALPPKVAAAAVEADPYPGAAVMSEGELDVLRYLVDRAKRGDQVEALRVELPPLRQGAHAPGESGCSCGICSPGRVGEELIELRSQNARLREENEALRSRSPAAGSSAAAGVGGGPAVEPGGPSPVDGLATVAGPGKGGDRTSAGVGEWANVAPLSPRQRAEREAPTVSAPASERYGAIVGDSDNPRGVSGWQRFDNRQ